MAGLLFCWPFPIFSSAHFAVYTILISCLNSCTFPRINMSYTLYAVLLLAVLVLQVVTVVGKDNSTKAEKCHEMDGKGDAAFTEDAAPATERLVRGDSGASVRDDKPIGNMKVSKSVKVDNILTSSRQICRPGYDKCSIAPICCRSSVSYTCCTQECCVYPFNTKCNFGYCHNNGLFAPCVTSYGRQFIGRICTPSGGCCGSVSGYYFCAIRLGIRTCVNSGGYIACGTPATPGTLCDTSGSCCSLPYRCCYLYGIWRCC